MDRSNFSDVAQLASNAQEAQKVKLLLSEVDLDLQEVPDPYYGGDDGFENVYQMVNQACEAIAKKLN
jgi:protein-tyrosine phosphatase